MEADNLKERKKEKKTRSKRVHDGWCVHNWIAPKLEKKKEVALIEWP